ncbi:putative disease resistance protein RGA3 [Corylus avellana]|uniref:putative disease resistance protein RGA3 n=1 Tax=Corylus avellana TaxID=13451 RepID=UPI00286D3246|nr:putative disease resistance protein RGA3 [Corylus avellana]
MMEMALSSLLQVLFDRLASPAIAQLRDLCGLKQNFEKLLQSLPMIQALLEDAEERQETDSIVKKWLSKLKGAAYDAEDLLDELASEIMLCEMSSSIGDQVRSFLLPFHPSKDLFHIACHQLPEMLVALDEIIEKGFSLNLTQKVHNTLSESSISYRETISLVIESEVYGRREDKEKIIELLHTTSNGKNRGDVPIIPIVGIGGLGKTTLAQLVYGDAGLMGCFDMKIWVYVSNDFEIKMIITAIIESVTLRKCEFTNLDILSRKLQETLCGKRYLLVLDDVWNEDQYKWQRFQTLLKGCVKGSKIIVTARSDKVASIVGTFSYHLKGLAEDDSWALFKQYAFGQGEEEGHPNLLPIGKQIVKKCGGVPLAARTLGGLLRDRREESYWLDVKESELWEMDDGQSEILPTLRLSYSLLRPYLKRCFAYCSLFPKSYEFKKEKLIHLWMAEGLILANKERRPLEDIGNDYFNQLLCLSFFQEVKESKDDGMKVYRMHDLIHDLAQAVAGDEFLKLEHAPTPSNLAKTRHSSILSNFQSSIIPLALLTAKRLRTLLLLSPGVSSGETLNLSGCYQLLKLPDSMGKLINLRHLKISGCVRLTHMPTRIGKLVHVQTWPIYIVGRGIGESIAELSCLNLRGGLNIKCLENVNDAEEAKTANLKAKHLHVSKLASSKFDWGCTDQFKGCKALPTLGQLPFLKNLYLQAMEGIECIGQDFYGRDIQAPFSSLKELTLRDFPKLKEWCGSNGKQSCNVAMLQCCHALLIKSMENLTSLSILVIDGFPELPLLSGDLLKNNILLTSLKFSSCPNLSLLPLEIENLTAPTSLTISWCKELKSLPQGLQNLKLLESLEISDCHRLKSLPEDGIQGLSSLRTLSIENYDKLSSLSTGLQYLSALEHLSIMYCPKLPALPDDLHNLSALRSLSILSCPSLVCLPEGLPHIKTLQTLEIRSCPCLSDFS